MRELTSAEPRPPGGEDHSRGPAGSAEVVFYGDFTCPDCAVAAMDLKELPVRVHFRHFAMSSRHRRAVPLAAAAEAAGEQGFFWEFHDSLFEDQGHLDDPHLWERCERLGIDVARFDRVRRSEETLATVRRQTSEALRAGATGTPAFLVDGAMLASLPASSTG